MYFIVFISYVNFHDFMIFFFLEFDLDWFQDKETVQMALNTE